MKTLSLLLIKPTGHREAKKNNMTINEKLQTMAMTATDQEEFNEISDMLIRKKLSVYTEKEVEAEKTHYWDEETTI